MNRRVRIYVVACEDAPYVKIGLASKPSNRVKGIQTGCPHVVSLAFETPPLLDAVAHQVEKRVHRMLSDHHRIGEWFHVAVEDAISAISDARRYIKNKRANDLKKRVHRKVYGWGPIDG